MTFFLGPLVAQRLANALPHTLSCQGRNCSCTVFHGEKLIGNWHHWQPVFTTYTIRRS
jgi:hypothetical protein